jgi:hypothetical protein
LKILKISIVKDFAMTVPTSRIMLITDANTGIGVEIARQVGKAGHHVLLGARNAMLGEYGRLDVLGPLPSTFVLSSLLKYRVSLSSTRNRRALFLKILWLLPPPALNHGGHRAVG